MTKVIDDFYALKFKYTLPKNKILKNEKLFIYKVYNAIGEEAYLWHEGTKPNWNENYYNFYINMACSNWEKEEIISIINDIAKNIGFEKE